MIDQTIGLRPQLLGPKPFGHLSASAGLRFIGDRLRQLWQAVQIGQPVVELDARLLRDIGLSEFTADRAVAPMYSQGMIEGSAAAGLGSCHGLFGHQCHYPSHRSVRIAWTNRDTP